MSDYIGLDAVQPGWGAQVCGLRSTGRMRRRLLDIGLVEGTWVECLGRSPGGDPSAYRIRGAVFAIRREDSADILVRNVRKGGAAWA